MKTKYIRNLLTFCIAFFFVSIALAQNAPGPSPTGGPKKQLVGRTGLPKDTPHRKARCKACEYVAMLYNNLLDEVDYLDTSLDVYEDISHKTDEQLNKLEAHIAGLKAQFIKQPSPANREKIATAEKQHEVLRKKFGEDDRRLSNAERKFDKLVKDLEEAKKTLDDCEAEFCRVGMAPAATQMRNAAYVSSAEVGILVGNQTNSRSGDISTPTQNFSGSNSQNNVQSGLQARIFFGSPELLHVFLMMNAITFFNASNNIMSLRTDSLSSSNSRLRLQTLWIAHFLIGLQTAMILSNLHLSGGIGGSVINQQMQTSISETQVTNNTKTQSSTAPSAMLSIDYDLCKHCLGAHDLTLSGQVTADKYPSISSTVTTPLGNTYQSNVNRNWQFSEALVLSMRF